MIEMRCVGLRGRFASRTARSARGIFEKIPLAPPNLLTGKTDFPQTEQNAPAKNGVFRHSKFLKIQKTFFKKFFGGVWGSAPHI
jgi:hypothetical protein